MAGADLLLLKTWLMYVRGEEWICCTQEQESISMLLKHNSKLSFIPFVSAKLALPCETGGLLQKNTPVAHRVPLLAQQELAKHPVQHRLLAAGRMELDTMGALWRTRERAANQGADTKPALFKTEVPPQPRTSDTWHLELQEVPLPRHKGSVCWCLRVTGAAGTEVCWVMCTDKQMQEHAGKVKGPPEQVPARVQHSATLSCS